MLLDIHLCLFFFSFLIHATPLHHARREHGHPKLRSRPLNRIPAFNFVKREDSNDGSEEDSSSQFEPMPTSTSLSSASSTSADPSSTQTDSDYTDDRSDNNNGGLNSFDDNDGSSNDNGWDEDGSENDSPDSDSSNNDEDSNNRNLKAATTSKKQGTTTKMGATVKNALNFKNVSMTGLSEGNQAILRASFTSNKLCGQTISCNAGKNNDHTGVKGVGATAVNKMLFGGPPGVYDGSGGHSNVNGLGGGCGSCWTLTPGLNYYEDNGIPLGKTVVVRINDECTDPGYCDQTPDSPLNTGPTEDIQPSGKFEAPVHFDLCEATGVAAAFFGELKTGVAMGAARYNPDCTGLEDGEFGAKTVEDLAMPF